MSKTVEASPSIAGREERLWFGLPWWQVATFLLLMTWLYSAIMTRLFLQWVGPAHDPNFEHGVFVPLFAGYVLWQDRKRLGAVPAAPSWTGLPIIAGSLMMLVLGVLGAENFLSRASLLFLLAGLMIQFRGLRFFRAALFPWAFLFLMVPIPNLVIQHVTFPLQLLASKVATGMLQIVGVPVLRQGNLIVLAAMPLDVAEACSGIRSLLTLVTLAIIYGYLMEPRVWVRVTLAVCAVPIAVVANSFRVFGTGMLVQYWDPEKAEGFFHTFEGWLIFVVALTLLFLTHRILGLIWKAAPPSPKPPQAEPSAPRVPQAAGLSNFVISAGLMLVVALGLQARAQAETYPPRATLASLPSQIDGWTSRDQTLDEETLKILGPGEFLIRDYENGDQIPINLYVAYFPTQKAGDTIHSPNHCLPGAGWVPTTREIVRLARPDGSTFPVNRYVVTKAGERQLVLYWFQAHGREVASEYAAKYWLIADAIRMNRSDGGLVRLMTPMTRGETPDQAQERLMQLGSRFVPILDNYIPR